MNTTKRQRGKMSEHFHGMGTPTRDSVAERAREIAVTNGRLPEQFTEADWEQARRELTGVRSRANDEVDVDAASAWDPAPGTGGHALDVRNPSDEQTVAEELVQEGVEEANHEQMVEGNRASREKDQI
jgi:hypothetical protein